MADIFNQPPRHEREGRRPLGEGPSYPFPIVDVGGDLLLEPNIKFILDMDPGQLARFFELERAWGRREIARLRLQRRRQFRLVMKPITAKRPTTPKL